MGCSLGKRVAEELIVGYAAQKLHPQAKAEFESHLSACRACRELAVQQGTVWAALDELQPLQVSADFDRKLAQSVIEAEGLRERLFAGPMWRLALSFAAACALVVLAFFLPDHDRASAGPAQNHPQARIEQRVEHALDDMDLLNRIGVDAVAERSSSSKI